MVESYAAPARLQSFQTCVASDEESLTPEWYKEHGIEMILGTHVDSVDVEQKMLLTNAGESISYRILLVATGAQALKLGEFRVREPDAENLCYLRNLADASKLVRVMQGCVGGEAVVIGGGYLAMECASSLVTNKIKVTMIFPEAHFMARLFTQKIASFYEGYYKARGVEIIRGTIISSFEIGSDSQKIVAVNLRDGRRMPASMVVVAIGIRPNTSLFEGQLTMEKGGIKVNGHMQSSNSSVYAVGDAAAFSVGPFGKVSRLEHADSARKSARHAVAAIMDPKNTGEFDYLPLFYSRAFKFAWRFYGHREGEAVHFGEFSLGSAFGAYWVANCRLVGSFLESGSKEEYEAIATATRLCPKIEDLDELERQGLGFALSVAPLAPEAEPPQSKSLAKTAPPPDIIVHEAPLHNWHAATGVLTAASIAGFAYWYGRKRRRW
uniref:monodehydroascorbate reductase (NADH) n=1 Tax=Kalanchoe fedtschenkoi TaxID=63787 RepID=A0A7N0UNN3_KALFE